ncbi:hypothetical protein [Achromobacter phage ewik_TL4]|nr:putative tail protein [Achromobacter phage AMA1]WNO48526.1 hypothetical protein [Achromobacter phage hasilly_LB3]WNO48722.1 hypothetical protein [Achromobacter phage nyaak_TL1]WNO48916.1 hypothetical protein [Achromobacter phage ewii_LB8]WNO49183.1 hypothetical protein [Achromobacter phage ewik_TL4]
MNTNPYAQFASDSDAEKDGIWINYDKFRVLLARAGGSNSAYLKAADRRHRAARRQGSQGVIALQKMSRELLIEACIKSWEVRGEDGKFMPKTIQMIDGEIVPFSKESVEALLHALPNLADALNAEANNEQLYLAEELEAEAGN